MVQQKEPLREVALRELAWYRVLTLKQILQLSGYKNEHWARDQLNILRQKEYLYLRMPYLSKGRLPGAYQLLPKGKRYLEEQKIDVPYVVQNVHKLQSIGSMSLQHTIGVNDVFIMLHLLTVQYPDRFQLLKRIHEREMSQYLTKRDGGVEPDGFFQININHKGQWKKQSCFLEYERTSAYADMEKFQQRIRNYLFLFDNTTKLDTLFGVKYPSLMIVGDAAMRVPILTTYGARVLHDCQKTEWESRFLFSSRDASLTPIQFFCSHRWLRAWLPLLPPVAYFTDQDDLLPSLP